MPMSRPYKRLNELWVENKLRNVKQRKRNRNKFDFRSG
jgi:hypothetical protein